MILVVGSGGNGQTYFMQFLKNNGVDINKVKDGDKLKHLSGPDKLRSTMAKNPCYKGVKVKKCIFLYNHPYYALLSHYRRKWQYKQFLKLGNPKSLTENSFTDFNYIKNATLKNNKDIYGFAFQFKNWVKETLQNDLDILFLDFNDIYNQKDRLDAFVGKELNYNLFSIKKRHNEEVLHPGLYIIYDKFYKAMKKRIKNREKRELLRNKNPEKYKTIIKKLRVKNNAKKGGCGAKKKEGTTCSIKKSACSKKNCCSR